MYVRNSIASYAHFHNASLPYMGINLGNITARIAFKCAKKNFSETILGESGAKLSGVKRIRLHDFRHSHASLLIPKLGAQLNLVAERLGHEKIQTTLSTYAHLYPNQARNLAEQL